MNHSKPLCVAESPCGCILIGGKSSRMGRPKQLIQLGGSTWVEIIARTLSTSCSEIVVVGAGELPEGNWQRVADLEICQGPLSGILAVMESRPVANFIICSCDLPYINRDAVQWLLGERHPDYWAIVPSLDPSSTHIEPLFAYYDSKMISVFRNLVSSSKYKLSDIASHHRVKIVQPPSYLLNAWKNCNTLEDLPIDTA